MADPSKLGDKTSWKRWVNRSRKVCFKRNHSWTDQLQAHFNWWEKGRTETEPLVNWKDSQVFKNTDVPEQKEQNDPEQKESQEKRQRAPEQKEQKEPEQKESQLKRQRTDVPEQKESELETRKSSVYVSKKILDRKTGEWKGLHTACVHRLAECNEELLKKFKATVESAAESGTIANFPDGLDPKSVPIDVWKNFLPVHNPCQIFFCFWPEMKRLRGEFREKPPFSQMETHVTIEPVTFTVDKKHAAHCYLKREVKTEQATEIERTTLTTKHTLEKKMVRKRVEKEGDITTTYTETKKDTIDYSKQLVHERITKFDEYKRDWQESVEIEKELKSVQDPYFNWDDQPRHPIDIKIKDIEAEIRSFDYNETRIKLARLHCHMQKQSEEIYEFVSWKPPDDLGITDESRVKLLSTTCVRVDSPSPLCLKAAPLLKFGVKEHFPGLEGKLNLSLGTATVKEYDQKIVDNKKDKEEQLPGLLQELNRLKQEKEKKEGGYKNTSDYMNFMQLCRKKSRK